MSVRIPLDQLGFPPDHLSVQPTPILQFIEGFPFEVYTSFRLAAADGPYILDPLPDFYRRVLRRPWELHLAYIAHAVHSGNRYSQVTYTALYFGTVAFRDSDGQWWVEIVDFFVYRGLEFPVITFNVPTHEIARRGLRYLGARLRQPARVIRDLTIPFPSLARTSRRTRGAN